jgi:gliding motility-associated-like protein
VDWSEDACDTIYCKFDIPNVFTPNHDGLNDLLRISNTCPDQQYTVQIFNRWGLLMFQQEAMQVDFNPLSKSLVRIVSWDGTIHGTAASEGTYFVLIQFASEDGRERILGSSVSLIR